MKWQVIAVNHTAKALRGATVTARAYDLHGRALGTAQRAKVDVAASTTAIVYYAVRTLTGDRVPSNDGCYRPVRIVLPPGSIVDAAYPAPVGSRGVALKRIEDVVLGALARLAPDRMCAAHSGQYTIVSVAGRDTVRGEPLIGHMGGPYAGGNGAQPRRDGIDCSDHGATNGSMVTIEDSESRLPLRFRKLELWTDSGGAGRFRDSILPSRSWRRSTLMLRLRGPRAPRRPRRSTGRAGTSSRPPRRCAGRT